MKTNFLVIAAVLVLSGCSVPQDKAQAFLEANGYRDIELGGADILFSSCSEDDTLTRNFTATASNGSRVRGTVCAGMFFKGATIRLDKVIAPVVNAAVPVSEKAQLCNAYAANKSAQPLAFMDAYCG